MMLAIYLLLLIGGITIIEAHCHCLRDERAPEPLDPYRLERWRAGERDKER